MEEEEGWKGSLSVDGSKCGVSSDEKATSHLDSFYGTDAESAMEETTGLPRSPCQPHEIVHVEEGPRMVVESDVEMEGESSFGNYEVGHFE